MKHYIHFNPETYEIVGWETTNSPQILAGCDRVAVDDLTGLSAKTHRICPVRKRPIEMTKTEKTVANRPTAFELKQAIAEELRGTDVTQIPDYPIGNKEREEWREYRHKLRRLSDLKCPLKMSHGFPKRPDGTCAAVDLQKRAV